MSADSALIVSPDLAIPRHELSFRATRAGGPGGQHVNKSSTRVELLWNVDRAGSLRAELRSRLREKLAARIDGDGNLRVVSSEHRSQARNREAAEIRLAALVRKALVVPRRRIKTRPGRGAVEDRLRHKKHKSEKKQRRRDVRDD